ncbi:MAG: hypothetical protein ABSF33_10240 [Acidimicrobiales bacterium]
MPRQFTDWRGKFMFENDPEHRWRDCRVLDVSSAGAGLELLGTRQDQIVGGRLLLAVHLRGELRNVGRGRDDCLRAGIEFVDLTDGERAYLDSLAELQVAW